jgi:TolB-like protein/DNA-binding winged helix-turn-helix (wHTH) protein/Tfp pilus assembly protein PilF
MDMRAQASSDETYQVGDLWIDVGQQIVSRNGVQVPLPRLSFDLLLALVKAHPRLLTVKELLVGVWSPAVVNPETVGQRVKLLRRSLGDDPRHPRYVIGVRGRGYRMGGHVIRGPSIAGQHPVSELRDAATANAIGLTRAPGALWSRRPLTGFLAVIVLALASLGIDRFWSRDKQDAGSSNNVDPKSVAVLPFVDVCEKRDHGYFADGLTVELINRLTTIAGVQVASKASSFYFKGRQAPPREIGRDLHVASFLEGSVQTSPHGLRITAELVRTDDGFQIWAGSFDRPLTDIFKVQDEITDVVSQALQLSLVNHYTPNVAPTANIEAYTLYLRSISHIANNGPDDYKAAVEELQAAVTLDPQFADAWAQLGLAILMKNNMHGTPSTAACAAARTAADHAVLLNERLEEGHRVAGAIFQYCDGNLADAEREFSRAFEVAPERGDALRSYAWLLVDAGRFNEAQQLARRAVDRDPFNSWNYVALGDAYWRSNRISEAEAAYRRAVQLNPTIASLHALYANVLLSAHKPVAAVDEAEREPDPRYRQLTLPIAFDAAGEKSDADREITAYESTHAKDDPGEIAVFYACRNDVENAIQWLRKFAAMHVGKFASLPNRIACFKNIESDLRYISLRQQLGQEIRMRPLTAAVRSFRHVDDFDER